MPKAHDPQIPSPAKPRGRPKALFKETDGVSVKSLDRGLELLSLLAKLGDASLSQLCEASGLPSASAHRSLTTLLARDFVAFDPQRQVWSIGLEAYRTGRAYVRRHSVLALSLPSLQSLAQETGETANLLLLEAKQLVVIGQVESHHPIRAFFPLGSRARLHASGAGKAILAGLSEQAFAQFTTHMDLPRYTPQTLTSHQQLAADLETARARHWAFDNQERFDGMACLGAAIYNELQQPFAGLSISGPAMRFTPQACDIWGPLLAQTAQHITRLCGGAPSP